MSIERNSYTNEEREIFESYWREQYEHEQQLTTVNDPFTQNCEVKAFISRSNGKGRSSRTSRAVILVHNKNTGEYKAYNPTNRLVNGFDDLATNIYEGKITNNLDPYTIFIERIEEELRK